MKKIICALLLVLLFGSQFYAQERIYFDEEWEVTTKDKMEYYRETSKQGNLTLIKDFYKNGALQMEAFATDPTVGEEKYEGKVTWYYQNGKIKSFREYKNNEIVGNAQSFDENGKLIEDISFTKDGMSGKRYYFKTVEDGELYNFYEEFDQNKSLTIVYDDDIKGIRTETTTTKDGKSTIKYYGEKGKYLGEKKYNDNYINQGIEVLYYYNPMQVQNITKYDKEGNAEDITLYRKNGKILQKEVRNKKNTYKKTYDESGKLLGELKYKYNEEYSSMFPQNGDDYQFDYEGKLMGIETYKNSITTYKKEFDEFEKVVQETFFEDGERQKMINYKNGIQNSTLIFKNGEPYDGVYLDEAEEVYKAGVLQNKKIYLNEKLLSEKKLNESKTGYITTNYDDNGKITYVYTQNLDLDAGFSAKITQYQNGKQGKTSVVENGYLKSGKLKYKSFTETKELETSGNWFILRVYDETGKLIQENKYLNDGVTDAHLDSSNVFLVEDFLLFKSE